MNDAMQITKDPAQLCRLLAAHSFRCASTYMVRRTNWLLAYYYLQGYRRFDIYEPITGKLTPHLLDKDGNMEYVSQELLYQINQTTGRLMNMDLRPKINQQGFSLSGQRNQAITQIIADSVFSEDQIRRVSADYSWTFTCLGHAGISSSIEDHPTIGLTADISFIHPRELYPFPLVGQDLSKAQGLFRERWIPISILELKYGKKKIAANLNSMEWYEADPSTNWQETSYTNQTVSPTGITYYGGAQPPPIASTGSLPSGNSDTIGVAKVRELWLDGPRGTVSRYVCTCGDTLLEDTDLVGLETYCNIGWSRFFQNGTWHGAGLFDLLFHSHRQLERLSKSLFNNVMNLDRYGILVLPQGQFNQNNALRDVGNGLRAMFWDPDPVAEGFNPFAIQPVNTGEMPGRVAAFARETLNAINPIADIIKEKGRVDSESGLQFLDDQITQALTSPTAGVVRAWGDMYRAGTQKALSKLAVSRRSLPVGSLTLDLAGAVIDSETSSVSFADNPLPDTSRLSFTIRAVSPRSTLARKQEALDLWAKGLVTDPVAFRLQALKENLDFPMWLDEDSGAYEMAIRSILTVFNDGRTPGRLILTPYLTKPEIVQRLLAGFLCGPLANAASPSVQNALKMFRVTLMQFSGLTLPNAVPNPDDAAMLSQLPPGTNLPMSLPSPPSGVPA